MNRLSLLLIMCFAGMALSAANPGNKDAKAQKITKKDTVFLIGHAHMDMNWLWTTSETMKMAQDNLR
ncbi:MAG: hypothetical protein LBB90_08015, partial [Tannerella sp.]|nr:hypothetical protein [Tannerella sp.]